MDLIHNNFEAGELSPEMAGRVDLPQYARGARTVENMVIKPTGGATRRPGFEILSRGILGSPGSAGIPATFKYIYFSDHSGFVWGVPLQGRTMMHLDAGGAARDAGGGLVGLPMTGHPYVVGETLWIGGTTYYNGSAVTVEAGTTANEILITDTYNAETFDGTENVFKVISGLGDSASRMDMDADGVIYYGGNWSAVNDDFIVKVETDGTKTFGFFDWGAFDGSGYSIIGLKLSWHDEYLYVLVSSLSGILFKMDVATGQVIWQSTAIPARGYDLVLDEEDNAYVRSGESVRKYNALDGSYTTLTDIGDVPAGVTSGLVYDLDLDNDSGLIAAGGYMQCAVGASDATKASMYNLGVRTLDDSAGDTYRIGDLIDGPALTETEKIGVGQIAIRDSCIYVITRKGAGGSRLTKLFWNGTSLSLVATVDGPTYGISLFFDSYGNLVVVNSGVGHSVPDRFYFYDTDLTSLSNVDDFVTTIMEDWDNLNWLRGDYVSVGTPGTTAVPAIPDTIEYSSLDVAARLVGFVHKTDRYVLAFADHQMFVFKGGDVPSIVLDGGAAYHLDTPWGIEEVWDLVFAPRGQAIFHPDHDIYELVCDKDNDGDPDTDWTLTAFASAYGPFLAANKESSLTITPSGTTGSITLTASAATRADGSPMFTAGHIGALWQLTHPIDEVVLQGKFTNGGGGADPYPWATTANSASITLKGKYTISIQWRGWGTLKLQRSVDGGGTWQTVKTWINPDDDHLTLLDIPDGGEELEDDVQYRFYINWGTDAAQDAMYAAWETQWKLMWLIRPPYCQYSLTAQATSQTGIVRITGYTSPTVVSATVLNDLGGTGATEEWAEGAWSPYRGYPAKGTIHESRIYAARTEYQPTTIWAGRPFLRRGDPRIFYGGTDVTDDDAFQRTIDNPDCHTIEWLASVWVLLMGSDGNLTKCIGASENAPMTPTQFNAMPQSGMGSGSIEPIQMGGHIVYAGRSRKRAYEITYSDDARVYNPEDLSQFAEHITGRGIAGWCFQQQPFPILWLWFDDGTFGGLTRDKQNNNLLAWHHHTTDGTVESMAVIPSDGDDEVWACIARDVNGTTKYYVERMKPFGPYSGGTDQNDCFFVDSGVKWHGGATVTVTNAVAAPGTGRITITAAAHGFSDGWTVRFVGLLGMTELNGHVYTVADAAAGTFTLKTADATAYVDGSAYTAYTSGGTVSRVTNTMSGLTHLAAETVKVLGDGQPYDGTVNASGVWTAGTDDEDYFHTIVIGRPYTHTLEPMWPEVRTVSGTLQGKKKKVTHCTLRLYMSAGGEKGGYMDTARTDLQTVPIDYLHVNDTVGELVTLHTEDVPGDHPGGWTETGSIVITGDDPLPMTVSAILFGLE